MQEPLYYGIYQGVVTSVKDKEKRGRLKMKCPDVLDADTESAWCDPVIPVAYDGGGDFCMPAIGETVWVMFIGGDPNLPVWIGNWWSVKDTPLGDDYRKLDDTRIISYKDFKITIHKNEATITNCGGANTITMDKNGIDITTSKALTLNGKTIDLN